MGLEYLKITPEIMLKISAYGEEEQGRLILAMISYALSGTEPEFDGMERFIWPTLKMDIDRCAASVEKQVANGNKGGRPSKKETQAKPSESQKNPTETQIKPTETQAKPSESLNTNTNINTNNQKEEVSNTNEREEDSDAALGMTYDELLEIRKAKEGVETAARRVGLPVDELADMDSMDKLIAEHGAENTLKAIDKLQGKTKETRCWNYVAGILRKEKSSGYSWREKPETSRDSPARSDTFQRHHYTSSDYKAMVTDLDADENADLSNVPNREGQTMLRYTKAERRQTYSAAIVDFDEEE